VSTKAFPNPESAWERTAQLASFDAGDVERRLGLSNEPLELLSGGLANLNVRLGSARVLRIYRRDRSVVKKEQALLQSGWASFVVPAVLGAGEDFLLLEYVPHGALGISAEHGIDVGQALAEIHRRRYAQSGFLGSDLNVATPFPDLFEAFSSYARSELERASLQLKIDLRSRVGTFLDAREDALRRLAGAPVLLHGDFKASNLHWTLENRLLVLDWEFAYAGPALMDIGQLIRWNPPSTFVSAFAESYRQHGGELPDDWHTWAAVFDLFNLVGLLGGAAPHSRRATDVQHRIERTLDGER
jgi:fructosamine-3-kinase